MKGIVLTALVLLTGCAAPYQYHRGYSPGPMYRPPVIVPVPQPYYGNQYGYPSGWNRQWEHERYVRPDYRGWEHREHHGHHGHHRGDDD